MNWLAQIFSHVCGQVHCWAPGGVAMPVCERCLGLYLGALWSFVLVLILRTSPTRWMLWSHGMAMLVMLPFGYHFVPHGPAIRTVSGFLFGMGMVYYLALVPAEILQLERFVKNRSAIGYAVAALLPVPLILFAVKNGSAFAGSRLALLAAAGLAVAALLALTNAACFSYSVFGLRQKAAA
jgi:uncharacterized membrane protein